jgi:hypothetical protein
VGNRIAAILFGIAITFPLERWLSLQWYFAVALGVLGYGCVRYIGYFIKERRYIKRTMQEADEAVRRGKARQISN